MDQIYRFQTGEFACVAINDGGFAGSAAMLFATAPEEALAEALNQYHEQPSSLSSPWTCLLVQTGSANILIDKGGGEASGFGGKLFDALPALGVPPENIDIVILSHIHGDHILGAVLVDGSPAFPNATYIMSAAEWPYWTEEKRLAAAPPRPAGTARKVLPVLEGRMRPLAEGEVVAGVRLLPAPGHAVVEISSGGKRLLYLADTALHPIHLSYPHWTGTVDQDPAQTTATRRRLFRRAARQKAQVLMFHFAPFPGRGYIEAAGKAWTWRAAQL